MARDGDWLSRTLRELREAVGLSQTAAAATARLGATPAAGQVRLARIETGTFQPTTAEVERLCAAYRAPAAVLSLCLLWASRDTREGGVSSRVILASAGEHQSRLGAVEEASHRICVWQPLLIPGLLQTEGYVRAVFSDRLRGSALDTAVAARMGRAPILASDREFTFVISEGALRWSAGPEVMAEQLTALAAAATHQRIGIVPQAQSVDTFPTHGFGLFDDRLVLVGLRHAAVLVGDPESVAEYVAWFAKLEALAAFGEDARQVIKTIARDYQAKGGG